jgi:hypothetical protein
MRQSLQTVARGNLNLQEKSPDSKKERPFYSKHKPSSRIGRKRIFKVRARPVAGP